MGSLVNHFCYALWISTKENPLNTNISTHKGTQNIQLRVRYKASTIVVRAVAATVAYAFLLP